MNLVHGHLGNLRRRRSNAPGPDSLLSPNVRQLLRFSLRDGVFYSLMVALGETYLVAYAIFLGINERNAAFVGTLPVIFGSILQLLIFARTAQRLSARRWVVTFAAVQGIMLCIVPLAPIFASYTLLFLIVAATIYWAAGFSAGPVWNGWVTSILPGERQKGFFYLRNAVSQIGVLLGILAAGAVLGSGGPLGMCFAALFAAAGICRFSSSYCLAKQPDAADFPFSRLTPDSHRLRKLIREPFVRNGILFSFFTNMAVHLSAPFFSPYMLKKLALNHSDYSILIAAAFCARAMSGYALERMLRVKQNQIIFKVGVFGIILVPYLWTLSDHYGYLLVLQALSGFFWGCHELGLTMLLVEKIETASRLRILSVTNLVSSMGMAVGCIVGWAVAATDSIPKETYHLLFTASSLLRLIPVAFLLPYIRLADHWQPAFRTLGVRPSGQGIAKPVIVDESAATGIEDIRPV